MKVGDKVRLTPQMMEATRLGSSNPSVYEGEGTITRIGSWGIVDVLWDKIGRPISIRSDEIEVVKDSFQGS